MDRSPWDGVLLSINDLPELPDEGRLVVSLLEHAEALGPPRLEQVLAVETAVFARLGDTSGTWMDFYRSGLSWSPPASDAPRADEPDRFARAIGNMIDAELRSWL